MNFLAVLLSMFESPFLSIWSRVSGVFATLLGEVPDQIIAVVHAGTSAGAKALAAGKDAETALQDAIMAAEVEFKSEVSADIRGLLNFFVTQTASKAKK